MYVMTPTTTNHPWSEIRIFLSHLHTYIYIHLNKSTYSTYICMYVYLLIYISRYVVELSYILGKLFNKFFSSKQMENSLAALSLYVYSHLVLAVKVFTLTLVQLYYFFLAIYSQKKKS